MNQDKRTWHAPELIDVGDVVELTEGMATNVRDNQGVEPPNYVLKRSDDMAEVDLDS